MVDDNRKAALGLGLVAAGGLVYALTKKPAPPEKPSAAEIEIKVYDAEGNLVPRNSPLALAEGQTYTAVVTVINQTTKAGVPWEATLEISTIIYINGTYFYDGVTTGVDSHTFGPGESHSFSYSFTVPLGSGGQSGYVNARVISPENVPIAEASEPITVEEIAIDYAATVVIE